MQIVTPALAPAPARVDVSGLILQAAIAHDPMPLPAPKPAPAPPSVAGEVLFPAAVRTRKQLTQCAIAKMKETYRMLSRNTSSLASTNIWTCSENERLSMSWMLCSLRVRPPESIGTPPGTRERGAASARLEEPVPQLQLQPLIGGSRLSAHSRGNNIDIEGARQRDEGC